MPLSNDASTGAPEALADFLSRCVERKQSQGPSARDSSLLTNRAMPCAGEHLYMYMYMYIYIYNDVHDNVSAVAACDKQSTTKATL